MHDRAIQPCRTPGRSAIKPFSNAVTFNPKTREFWRTQEGADNELFQMQNVKASPATTR